MKILVVSPSFPPDKTVGAVRMASLVRYLLKTETVSVLTNKKNIDKSFSKASHYFIDLLEEGSYFVRFKENQKRYCDTFRKICGDTKFDLVLVSGGPFFTFEIAAEAEMIGLPCILDYRDPWFFDYRGFKNFFAPKRLVSRLWELPMERRAVKAAKKVVTVTPNWVKTFKRLYPTHSDKFELVENGYDDVLLNGMDLSKKTLKHDEFVFGVFGKVFYYTEKYSKVFLRGVADYQDKIKLLQVGNEEDNAKTLLAECGVGYNFLESTGFMDYNSGIKTLSSADVFLIIDIRKTAIGTKIYDYIFLNKPIVYVGPKNTEIAKMVEKFSNGYVCSTSEELKKTIGELVKKRYYLLDENCKAIAYSRSEQNKKWVELIKDTVELSRENN